MSALPQVTQPTQSLTPVQPLPVLASVTNDTPLTRVSLAFIAYRIDLSLRFGHPLRELPMDSGWRCAVFLPGALFCRTHWACLDDSSVRWQLMVLQACAPWDGMRGIAGSQPGAHLMLHAQGALDVQSVLQQIDTIEALGIDPVAVSPEYWRTLGERLAARRPLPAYTDEQHAAYGAGEVWP
jgi:Protein of unknown function (DUF2840)